MTVIRSDPSTRTLADPIGEVLRRLLEERLERANIAAAPLAAWL